MGNSLGGKKSAKVMKINGETFKFKTPVRAGSIVANHPGHVLLESEAVKHYGVRAKPLEPQQDLKPKRLYFLVELPKVTEDKGARRVRSGIHMSAKDRLESMMLARRSASDLSIMKPQSMVVDEKGKNVISSGGVRVKMRLPKAEVERLMAESKDGAEVAEKIVSLCMATGGGGGGGGGGSGGGAAEEVENVHWKNDFGVAKRGTKLREKRVGFLPISEREIQLAVAS